MSEIHTIDKVLKIILFVRYLSVHSSDVTRIFGVNMFCIRANLETFLCLLGVDGRVKPFEVRERRECEREERRGRGEEREKRV